MCDHKLSGGYTQRGGTLLFYTVESAALGCTFQSEHQPQLLSTRLHNFFRSSIHLSHTLSRHGDLALCIAAHAHWPQSKPPAPTHVYAPSLYPTGFQIIKKKMFRFCRLSITPLSGISSCSAITNAGGGGHTLRK